eukprot:TRINITY_DN95512_c0_g1_i1.p1 TRINITY_DN95512_c0_g1~~TRINITY_DN95512_c0_g1_i1.p1  ORF type:complete len:147 (-),score=21.86 TRINITY_DN95512_c0_g1_i1:42-482(-)
MPCEHVNLRWTRACQILEQSGVPREASELVLRMCYDKAVILAEFSETWVSSIAPTQSVASELSKAVANAAMSTCSWETQHPQRYLQFGSGFEAVYDFLHLPYHERASLLKPAGWAWVEVMAAGGYITLFWVSAAIEMAFKSGRIEQ